MRIDLNSFIFKPEAKRIDSTNPSSSHWDKQLLITHTRLDTGLFGFIITVYMPYCFQYRQVYKMPFL